MTADRPKSSSFRSCSPWGRRPGRSRLRTCSTGWLNPSRNTVPPRPRADLRAKLARTAALKKPGSKERREADEQHRILSPPAWWAPIGVVLAPLSATRSSATLDLEVQMPVRVLIVDDQEPFRLAARMVVELTDGFEVVGEAETRARSSRGSSRTCCT